MFWIGHGLRLSLFSEFGLEWIGGAAMAAMFVLGMGAFFTGLCCLASKCVAGTLGSRAEASKPIESCAAQPALEIPDTVPIEWINAYRADNDV